MRDGAQAPPLSGVRLPNAVTQHAEVREGEPDDRHSSEHPL